MSRVAAAEDAPSSSPAPNPERIWYGWQTLAADGGSILLGGVTALVTQSNAKLENLGPGLFLAGYGLGAPIVHFAHGNAGGGGASIALRLGLPLVGGIAGFALAPSHSDWSTLGYIGLGMLLGAGGAAVIDASVLAYNETKLAPKNEALHVVPSVGFVRGKPALGLSGTF
jgi:hypothetical protein